MSKYEIMLIIDPNSDEKVVSEIAKSSFKSKDVKIERLERTELAYEINKSKTGIYILVLVEATGSEINEFIRKANISKNIWRTLSINLDSEKGLNRKAKPKKVKKPFVRRPQYNRENKDGGATKTIDKNQIAKSSTTKKEETKTKEEE